MLMRQASRVNKMEVAGPCCGVHVKVAVTFMCVDNFKNAKRSNILLYCAQGKVLEYSSICACTQRDISTVRQPRHLPWAALSGGEGGQQKNAGPKFLRQSFTCH